MDNRLEVVDFTRSLPEVLKQDDNIFALAKVLSGQLQNLVRLTKKTIIYADIDNVDEAVLDILGYDLHVDWYDDNYPVETKRTLIKDSVKIHRQKATLFAVETALKSIYPQIRVEEWFEYGGEPFTFRLVVEDDISIPPEKYREIIKTIDMCKRVVAHIQCMVLSFITFTLKQQFTFPRLTCSFSIGLWNRPLLLDGFAVNDGSYTLNGTIHGVRKQYKFRTIHGFKIPLEISNRYAMVVNIKMAQIEFSNKFSVINRFSLPPIELKQKYAAAVKFNSQLETCNKYSATIRISFELKSRFEFSYETRRISRMGGGLLMDGSERLDGYKNKTKGVLA